MMVKIDLAKIIGSDYNEEKNSRSWNKSLLPRFASTSANSRTYRPSVKTIKAFVALAVIIQCLISYRLFFPAPSSYSYSPPYNAMETVELVTKWYKLLQHMHYLGRDAIAYPPHVGEKAINISVTNKLGLDPRVIDTLLQLPYITPHEDLRDSETGENLSDEQLAKVHESDSTWWPGWMQGRDILWRNGHFVDYRDDANLYQSRDRLKRWQERYSDGVPFEDSMLDWGIIPNSAIPLSFVGRPGYCLILVLDTATNRIAVLDTQGGGNADPFFEQFGWDDMKSDYKVPWMYNGKDMSVRLVSDLLLDFITRTANLEEGFMPGSVRSDYHFSPELSPPKWEAWVRDLYLKLGWRPLAGLKACNSSRVEQPGKTFDPCDYEPVGGFETSSFDEQIRSLRHNITSRYLPDWYCPVPRQADVIEGMKQRNWLTEDQIAYAESDEPIIPLNLEGWGGRLIYSSNNRLHF